MKAGGITSTGLADIAENHHRSGARADREAAGGKCRYTSSFRALQVNEHGIHPLLAPDSVYHTAGAIRDRIEVSPVFLTFTVMQYLQAFAIGYRPRS